MPIAVSVLAAHAAGGLPVDVLVKTAVDKQADLLVEATRVVSDAVHRLRESRKLSELSKQLIDIHDKESIGDDNHHAAMSRLFSGGTDALEVIKWKELYDLIEEAIDGCEDVGNTLERIVGLLGEAEVVRPQNYYLELPWQAPKAGPDLNCCAVNANRPLGMIAQWAVLDGGGCFDRVVLASTAGAATTADPGVTAKTIVLGGTVPLSGEAAAFDVEEALHRIG